MRCMWLRWNWVAQTSTHPAVEHAEGGVGAGEGRGGQGDYGKSVQVIKGRGIVDRLARCKAGCATLSSHARLAAQRGMRSYRALTAVGDIRQWTERVGNMDLNMLASSAQCVDSS